MEPKKNPSQATFSKIRSRYIMNKILNILDEKKKLKMVKYSKRIRFKMGLSYINYNDHAQTFSTIELELHLTENSYGKFINMEEGKEKYYHIFFGKIYINEKGKKYKSISYNEKEAKKDYIDENEQVDVIKIIIDHQIE